MFFKLIFQYTAIKQGGDNPDKVGRKRKRGNNGRAYYHDLDNPGKASGRNNVIGSDISDDSCDEVAESNFKYKLSGKNQYWSQGHKLCPIIKPGITFITQYFTLLF